MRVAPIRYARDVEASRRFYEALGLDCGATTRPPRPDASPGWVEFHGESGTLALHYLTTDAPPSGVELAFEATEPLEAVLKRLRSAGYEPASAIFDESYGRAFTVVDPDGLQIQITEYDRDLNT